MTGGRLAMLLIGTPFLLLIIGGLAITEVAHFGQGTYQVRLSIPVRGHSVEISLDSGDLRVRQLASPQLQLGGTATYSLVRSTVTSRTTSTRVTVASACHFVSLVCSFDYRLGLPDGAAETFSDGQGDITVTGITNPIVTASDSAGDITLTFTKVPSRVMVTDAFGDVRIVLPRGLTVYNVITHAQLGTATIAVPTSSLSKHIINVTNSSGNILITN
jgi:hypothetical protein